MSVSIKMTALADASRELSGTTVKKGIDAIIEDVSDANEEITDQSALISQILDAVNNLPEAKGDNCIDVTDITRGESDVSVDEGQVNVREGYYPSRVVKTIESVEQATPDITVFSTGQIIAKATQAEGYVYGGTKQKSTQLTTQAAKTVTPTTTNQTAVASGRYTTGAVTVKGDSNLKAENIKKDVTIFGVKGTLEGGGGGSDLNGHNITIDFSSDVITSFQSLITYVKPDGTIYDGSMVDEVKTYNDVFGLLIIYIRMGGDGELTHNSTNNTMVDNPYTGYYVYNIVEDDTFYFTPSEELPGFDW